MTSVNKAGFTIIEVMLFLGISGLLFVGILAGTGNAINVQRYHDSVSSLQSMLQQQYSETSNVINDNVTNLCGSDSVPRGQSNCVVLGRFITTTDGKTLSVKNVIGSLIDPTDITVPATDIEAFHRYDMRVSTVDASAYDVEWGAILKNNPAHADPQGFSMLILRSPLSGVVRTFLDDGVPPKGEGDLTLLSSSGFQNKPVELCVDSNGLAAGSKLAVQIDANSANESGIQVLGESNQIGALQCH